MANDFIAEQRARVERAREFAEKWAGRGYEKGDTHSFWLELLRDVVGMADVTTNVRFEQSTSERGFIDVVIRDAKTVIEQKSLGVDLDRPELRQGVPVTPFEQAKRYADSLPNSQRPDTIIVCDFDHFRIHDLDSQRPAENYTAFRLAELPEQLHLLDFLIDPKRMRQAREERVSLQAGELIGKLYEMLRECYIDPDSEASRHSLNVLCVRLVFCLFAEDAGLFPKNAFYRYFKGMPAAQVRGAMKELFAHLRSAPEDRDPYASAQLSEFPYVNGGLFEAEVEVPNFTEEIMEVLLEEVSNDTNWSEISPTVFGGVFESTLNPETRRSGGMHYTSPENIHKVIDPLFLDELIAELESIVGNTAQGAGNRAKALRRFHDKIASLTFFERILRPTKWHKKADSITIPETPVDPPTAHNGDYPTTRLAYHQPLLSRSAAKWAKSLAAGLTAPVVRSSSRFQLSYFARAQPLERTTQHEKISDKMSIPNSSTSACSTNF